MNSDSKPAKDLINLENQTLNIEELELVIEEKLGTILEKECVNKLELFDSKLLTSLEQIDIRSTEKYDQLQLINEKIYNTALKRIITHPIVITLTGGIISTLIVFAVEYFLAPITKRVGFEWLTLKSSLVFVPLLTIMVSIVINLVISNVKTSIDQENAMNVLVMKNAIKEAVDQSKKEWDIRHREENKVRIAAELAERKDREAAQLTERKDREAAQLLERQEREADRQLFLEAIGDIRRNLPNTK